MKRGNKRRLPKGQRDLSLTTPDLVLLSLLTEEPMYGYLDGYLLARNRACDVADDLFEVGMPHRLGDDQHPTEIPSGRCLAVVDTFSRYKFKDSSLDVDVYVKPITEFYSKHPQYQAVPFPFLMEFLSDKKCSTADQLYQMALAGKLSVVR